MLTYYKVTVQSIDDNDFSHSNEIRLSKQLFRLWKVDLHQSLSICFGQHEATIECMPLEQNELLLQCSKTLANKLILPDDIFRIGVAFDHEYPCLHLGPVVAILTKVHESEHEPSFGPLSSFCKEMATYANENHVFLYVFSLDQWQEEHIYGCILQNEQWCIQPVPKPSVIYNRIGSRKLEQSDHYQTFFSECTQQHIHIFNDHFLNKWEVHNILTTYDELKPYLPETTLLTNQESLEQMIETYQTVYLKPIHGKEGKGIFRIQETNNYQFEVDFLTASGPLQRTFSTIDQLYRNLKYRIKKQQFLIQQGLTLTRYKNRSLDFRVLCARDLYGKWRVISLIARASREEMFVANLAQGGEVLRLEDSLHDAFAEETIKQFRSFITELAVNICEILSTEASGLYGEFGIDIGIDENGHPWMIEVNTKPSKNQAPLPAADDIRPSAKSIIHYAYHLATHNDIRG
ncbi:YheC/YheD family endospore coat-associated protein [Desertibacillus haloalkaliphilus]|uniref:YheC/YheD family endospore coat-associated protein n=1 Tax=Desertibacillus haloalkaliphilus TaxID=1328930 RepID=UPI001C27C4BB|nr:YheC/YheD family protein [Desertibacillus haloalkaliphilus]MBU8905429.1 YheC/YheD family protein [Desertibacillus haloalkaliphilus]